MGDGVADGLVGASVVVVVGAFVDVCGEVEGFAVGPEGDGAVVSTVAFVVFGVLGEDQATRFPDWDALSHVPSELRYELENLRQQLQQKLKIAEIDLSLQRARLAREDSKLQTKAEHVARQMRQMGLSTDDGSPAATATPNRLADGQQGRRWLQFLQRSTAASNNSTEGS